MPNARSKKRTKGGERRKRATEYELLVRDVLRLLYARAREEASIEHNIYLPTKAINRRGKPVMRQIDVYATFADQERVKALVVQAKNWRRTVPLPIVDSLNGMLMSLAQRCRGMMVTSSSYQSGAVLVAKQQGLELCVLRKTRKEDFSAGEIPEISGEIYCMGTSSDQVQIHVRPEDYSKVEPSLRTVAARKPEDIDLFDALGTRIGTMADLHTEAHKKFAHAREYNELGEYQVTVPLYMQVDDQSVQVLAFRGRFSRRELCRRSLSNTFTHIFGSLRTNEIYLLDQNGHLYGAAEKLAAHTEWIDMKQYFPEWFETPTVDAASA